MKCTTWFTYRTSNNLFVCLVMIKNWHLNEEMTKIIEYWLISLHRPLIIYLENDAKVPKKCCEMARAEKRHWVPQLALGTTMSRSQIGQVDPYSHHFHNNSKKLLIFFDDKTESKRTNSLEDVWTPNAIMVFNTSEIDFWCSWHKSISDTEDPK